MPNKKNTRTEELKKKSAGSPRKYTDEVIENEIIPKFKEFMSQQEITVIKTSTRFIRGERVQYEEEVGGMLPTLYRACVYAGIKQDTAYDLARRHLGFSQIIAELREMEKEFVIQNAVRGYYKEAFSRFIMINISEWSDAAKLRVDPQSLTDEDLIMYAKTALGLLEKEKVTHADRNKKTK
jgi:hypothetical protein